MGVGFGDQTRNVKIDVDCSWGRTWCLLAGAGLEPLAGFCWEVSSVWFYHHAMQAQINKPVGCWGASQFMSQCLRAEGTCWITAVFKMYLL